MNKNDASAVYYEGRHGELYQAIILGKVPNHRRFLLLGNNPTIDIATVPEDVWSSGGVYPFINAPVTLEVLSASALDTAAGTGARTVAVNCLDSNWVEVTHVLTLNGVTPVAFPATIRAINVAQVITAGSGEVNAGIITFRDSGGGTTRALIPAGTSQTRAAVYTVPAGHTLHVTHFLTSINRATGTATSFGTVGLGVRSVTNVNRIPFEYGVSNVTPSIFEVHTGAVIAEKETIYARVLDVSVNATNVTVALTGILSKNT